MRASRIERETNVERGSTGEQTERKDEGSDGREHGQTERKLFLRTMHLVLDKGCHGPWRWDLDSLIFYFPTKKIVSCFTFHCN